MSQESRPRNLFGGRLVISLLALLGLVVALAGGVVVWQRLHAPPQQAAYHHTPNAVNTGKSILYFSQPGVNSNPTRLTMVRTSDGAKLWQYSLKGSLSTGGAQNIEVGITSGGVVEVANGVIYFVDDLSPFGSPNHEQVLTALRAADGAVLWRRPVQGVLVELFGVSDGVVCIRVTQEKGSMLVSSALSSYNAQTGALAWQRQGADVSGSPGTQYGVYLFDGILYVTSAIIAPPGSPTILHALQPSTGRLLWQYVKEPAPGARVGQFPLAPVAVDHGVVVMHAWFGSDLLGMRESDGAVLWRYQGANILTNVYHGELNGPGILEQGGALYFGTISADGSLQLNSLQVATGRLLWRQPISGAKSALWDLTIGGDSVFAVVIPQWPGLHPVFDGPQLSSVSMGSGKLRWQNQPAAEAAPYFAGAGAVLLYATASSVTGVNADTGATLWRRPFAAASVGVADGTVILNSLTTVNSSGGQAWTNTLCGVQQATGTTRWCDQIAMGIGPFVPGP